MTTIYETEQVDVSLAPLVTPSGATNTFTIGGAAVAIDSGVAVTSYDTDLTGATVTINNPQSGDGLNFVNQNGISGNYSAGVLTLSGSAPPAQYQAALQSVTFSSTSANSTTRSLSIVAIDGAFDSNPAAESVLVAFPPPVVTASGSMASYTAGAAAVAVDPGVTVSSDDSQLTGATVTITNVLSGDTLNFVNQNGISGTYSSGVLTLSGSATPAQYQTALQSVAFSSTAPNTTIRTISIVALDGASTSNAASEQVSVFLAPKVTDVVVDGSSWATVFNLYFLSHGLGTAGASGFVLQTGSNQLTTLPWANINTIEVQFNEAVNIAKDSLQLSGGSGGSTPTVTGFSAGSNHIYKWTLSGPLTDNQYLISIASTTSGFGTPVTDSRGAGLSGAWTTGSSNFTTGSGNGLAGGTFNFYFNVLPGDGFRKGVVNSLDTAEARALVNDHTTNTGYSPNFDYNGAGLINTIDSALDGQYVNDRLPADWPVAPAASQAGSIASADFSALALSVQETDSAQAAVLQAGSAGNVGSISPSAATNSASSGSAGSDNTLAANAAVALQTPQNLATDEVVSDFDLVDAWV
jgi:hypothetical protein